VSIVIQAVNGSDVFSWYKKRSKPVLIHLPDILLPQATKHRLLIGTAGSPGCSGDLKRSPIGKPAG